MKHSIYALTLCTLLVFLLAGCETSTTQAEPRQSPLPVQSAKGRFQEYALPQANSGLMRPAIDEQGKLWFGEMSRNFLGSFNPSSKKFWQEIPPAGASGIMGLAVAADGTIWFAEQYANYIGHYFPKSGQYRTYPLPVIKIPESTNSTQTTDLPAAPNDLVLDQRGNLWFTEINANAIGCLHMATGSLRQYMLKTSNSSHQLSLYGITVDPHGIIWFTSASSNQLGQLNPGNGQVSYFTPAHMTSSLMEIISDSHGQLWMTTFEQSLLIRFDPGNSQFTTFPFLIAGSDAGSLYGVMTTANGNIWVTVTSENMLARLDSQTGRFLAYLIPTPDSQPLGLTEGSNQAIWFTEAGANKIGVLYP